ncbi:class I SAM-dependent methyltransferase [Lacinutrix gracilariae]|uniref:Class I SAM-dependent methyltransferase n=1 Tax=Lacinutrix gracilariae TaxID=1747198 RepID=A0ABW5K2U9_9FLAO
MKEPNKLTTQKYWETYYSKNHANKKHIVNVCSYYDPFWDQLISQNSKGKSIIEIGGFPGRYLAYLSSKFGLVPTCLDFNSDESQIKNSFEIMEVDRFNILQEDFTKYQPKQQYDYVISNGFIEHFDDFNTILDLHTQYLKPGGSMLVMIPNKRYLRKIYGYLCDYNNLKAHNLKSMKLSVFKKYAKRNDLKIKTHQYYGGFPFSVHQKQNAFQKVISKTTRLVFKKINPYLMKNPSKYLSASIIAIFEKPINVE